MIHHRQLANKLSHICRDILIEHIDGASFAPVKIALGNSARTKAINFLVQYELLYYPNFKGRPSSTKITENGRMVLGYVLADCAEALIEAGYKVSVTKPNAMSPVLSKLYNDLVTNLTQLPEDQSYGESRSEEASTLVPRHGDPQTQFSETDIDQFCRRRVFSNASFPLSNSLRSKPLLRNHLICVLLNFGQPSIL